jgi:hypothetical protein
MFRKLNCCVDVTIAEAETFIYASRADGPAQARIFRIKEAVPLAALPATRTTYGIEGVGKCLSPIHQRDQCSAHGHEQHGGDIPPGIDHLKRWSDRIDAWRFSSSISMG